MLSGSYWRRLRRLNRPVVRVGAPFDGPIDVNAHFVRMHDPSAAGQPPQPQNPAPPPFMPDVPPQSAEPAPEPPPVIPPDPAPVIANPSPEITPRPVPVSAEESFVEQPSAPSSRRRSRPKRKPARKSGSRTVVSRSHHELRCVICRHPDREAIEEAFLQWRCVAEIQREFRLPSRTTVYRHARACGLFPRRGRNLRAALEHIIECAEIISPTAGSIVRAIEAYTRLTADGKWIDPPAHVVVSSGASYAAQAQDAPVPALPVRVELPLAHRAGLPPAAPSGPDAAPAPPSDAESPVSIGTLGD